MKKISVILILLAGILWGCLGIFVRTLNSSGISSMQIVTLRAFVTTLGMFVFLLFYDRKLLKVNPRDLWCFAGTGICSILFFNFCYFKAITLTTMSVAAVLLYTAPFFVMLMSYVLFRESITLRKICAIIMTVAGCALVTGIVGEGAGAVTPIGILTGLGAGFGYALYSIFSRFALKKNYHTFTITFYTFLFTSVGCLVFTDVRPVCGFLAGSSFNLLFAVAFGILGTVIPYITYTLGLKHVENGIASIIASIEPVTATLIGIFLYHESLSAENVIGLVIVMTALVMTFAGDGKKAQEQ